MAAKSLADRMTALVDELNAHDELLLAIRRDEANLRWQAAVLFEVAYDGLPKGDAYYRVVADRLGQEAADSARRRDGSASNDGVASGSTVADGTRNGETK